MKDQLIEKMRAACKSEEFAKLNVFETCANVATAHFADKWVKVTEGLPDEGCECLVMINGLRGTAMFTEVDGVWQFVNENYSEGCGEFEQEDITHWLSISGITPPQE